MRLTVAGSRQSAFGPIDWALLVGTSLIWGTSFLWIKLAVEAFKPGLVALLRVTLGFMAILLMLIVLHRGNMNQVAAEFRFVWGPNHRLRVILLGIGWMGGPFMLLAIAAQYIDSSLSGMLIGAMPLMVAVIASISLRKLPGGKQQIGLVIGFAGVVMIVMADMASLTSADDAVNATSAATASTAATAATASTAAVSASTEVPASSVALGIVLCLLCALSFSLCATAAVPLQQKMTKRAGPFGFLPVVASMQFVSILICLPYGILDGLRVAKSARARRLADTLGRVDFTTKLTQCQFKLWHWQLQLQILSRFKASAAAAEAHHYQVRGIDAIAKPCAADRRWASCTSTIRR